MPAITVVARVQEDGALELPEAARRELDLRPGDQVRLTIEVPPDVAHAGTDVSAWLRTYREAAAAQRETNPKKHDRWAEKMHAAYLRLRESPEGRAGIAALMADPDPWVRQSAAFASLAWAPAAARAVLEAMADGDGPWFPSIVLERFDAGERLLEDEARRDLPRSRALPRRPVKNVTRDDIPWRIERAGLAPHTEALMPQIRDTIRIWCHGADDRELLTGTSKIGGWPDLPPGVEWPAWDDLPMSFVAQINLSEAAAYEAAGILPKQGLLTFFYDCAQTAWGYDPAHRGACRVSYHDHDPTALRRTPPPADLPSECVYAAFGLHFSSQITAPPWECVEDLCLSRDEQDRYIDKVLTPISILQGGDGEGEETIHRILGHPDPVQDDVFAECERGSTGADARLERLGDWELLLQVSSEVDSQPEMMWGDVGRLYFCIRREDLLARRFENVWAVLQG